MSDKFVLPDGYSVTAEATKCWGETLIHSDRSEEKFSALVIAICDLATSIAGAKLPAQEIDSAYSYIMPETFSNILTLLQINEPEFGPPEIVEKFGPDLFDQIFLVYYKAFRFEVQMDTRPGSNKRGCLPLVRRMQVHLWLFWYILATPDEFWNRLNVILRDMPALINPLSEDPYIVKIIPRSCFPETASDQHLQRIIQAVAEFKKNAETIIDNAQPLESDAQRLAQAQQNYQNQVQLARIQRDHHRDMLGGWKKDENGQDVYVEGWMS